jgi:SAM-dependent methyltransferase
MYNADYFESGVALGISGYSNYRWMPELTIPMCARIVESLGISDNDRILDFGCAKGYLVYALRLLHKQCWGYDISEYAISTAKEEIKPYITNKFEDVKMLAPFNLCISKDVFEHIAYNEISDIVLSIANISSSMFAIVPLGKYGRYIVPSYENDTTHIIREDISWWTTIFESSGFSIVNAEYNMKYIKQNYERWEQGNGFFTLKSNRIKI